MIDSQSEQIITFGQAADDLPRRRRGRKTHVSTLYRWATVGCRGVVLETIQIGATRCTSREALQRFFERLSATTPSSVNNPAAKNDPRSSFRHLRAAEAAGKELEQLGV